MTRRIRAVILDWAGTVVDYGCFAPMHAFLHTFEQCGVPITVQEARAHMGLLKRDHIQAILGMGRVRKAWFANFGAEPTEADQERLYELFEMKLMDSLEMFTTPLPGVVETVAQLREAGIRIGSTTGYTKQMLGVVAAGAKRQGYAPDFMVSADEMKAGRPYPYMIFRNLCELEIFPPAAAVKVGDTLSDIHEGNHAAVWSVGVIRGSSELGLTEEEAASLPTALLQERMDVVRGRFEEAGADVVIESIHHLPAAIEEIERRLQASASKVKIM